MGMVLVIIIGFIMGTMIALINNKFSKPKGVVFTIIIHIIEDFFGILGAISANQLVNYGPEIFNISILPTITGGLVLAFVAWYPGKSFFHF